MFPGRLAGRAGLLTLACTLAVSPTASASSCPDRIERDGPWSVIEGPSGLAALHQLAVDPERPERIFVTDGAALARSVDGGCTWTEPLRLASAPAPEVATVPVPQPRILDIAVSRRSGRVAVAAAAQGWTNQPGVGVPVVHVSEDGGQTFTASAAGLPQAGIPGRIAFAPSDPSRLLLSFSEAQGAARGLVGPDSRVARSADGGRTWALSEPLIEGAEPDDPTTTTPGDHGLAIDPLDPDRVWTTGHKTSQDSGLLFSEDGGATFRAVGPEQVEFRRPYAIIVDHLPGRPARIRTFNARYADSGAAYLVASDDGGATWGIDTTDGLGPSGSQYQYRGWVSTAGALEDAVSTTGNSFNPKAAGVFRYVPSARAFAPIPAPEVGVMHETSADGAGGYAFLALERPQTIVRYAPTPAAAAAADGGGAPGPAAQVPAPAATQSGAGVSAGSPAARSSVPALVRGVRVRPGRRLVAVTLRGRGSALSVRVFSGRRTIARGRVAKLDGSRTVRLRVSRSVRRGARVEVVVTGRDAAGRRQTLRSVVKAR